MSKPSYMLDTNTVSALIRGNKSVMARLIDHRPEDVCVSTIVAAELHFGLARRPEAVRLAQFVKAFLASVRILPFEAADAVQYGRLRAQLNIKGLSLSPMDMLIVAHAQSSKTILVSNDKAIQRILVEDVEDWIGVWGEE